jgi:hypothetical protein
MRRDGEVPMDGDHVALVAPLQAIQERRHIAVGTIDGDAAIRDAHIPRLVNLGQRDLGLGLEGDGVRDVRLRPAVGAVGPGLRQILYDFPTS